MNLNTKKFVLVMCLIFLYPVGIGLMLVWREKWPLWIRILAILPLVLAIVLLVWLKIFWSSDRVKNSVESANRAKNYVECMNSCYDVAIEEKLTCEAGCKK